MGVPVAELLAERFHLSAVFAVDMAWLLSDDPGVQQRFQSERATGRFTRLLFGCLEHHTNNEQQWRSERSRLEQRMEAAEKGGGKRVWTTQFLDKYSPLLLTNNHRGMWINAGEVHEDVNLDRSRNRYDHGYLRSASYRMTREGILLATYQAEFRSTEYSVTRVIHSGINFRHDAFDTLHHFLVDYFGPESMRESLRKRTGFDFDGTRLDVGKLLSVIHRHTLIVMEGFHAPAAGRPPTRVTMTELVESHELAGILNESPWYQNYGERYRVRLHGREFGYRADEIYVSDRHCTVVVAERYWSGPDDQRTDPGVPLAEGERDPLRWYQADLLTTIEHLIARLALLTQQLEFFRRHESRRPLEAQKPASALPVVLDARANLNQLIESLDFSSLTRHGFTRLFALRLRDEIGLQVNLEAVQRRVQAMSDAITLKSSVTFARSNNLIQAVSMWIAFVALALTIVALLIQR